MELSALVFKYLQCTEELCDEVSAITGLTVCTHTHISTLYLLFVEITFTLSLFIYI